MSHFRSNLFTLLGEETQKSILLQETRFFLGGEGGGGVTQERFSNVSNNRFFSSRKITGKPISKEEYYR